MTQEERHKLQAAYVNAVINDLDRDSLIQYAIDKLNQYLDKFKSDTELLDAVEELYPELLMEALRPTQVASGREGAFQALDRLCEENFDGLKRLAQEDNN